eukprot:tig00000829_g4667.t1
MSAARVPQADGNDVLEFLAGDEPVEIIPSFSLNYLELVARTFRPFKPQVPVKVPLWLAIHLKKRSKCKLIPPPWLTRDALSRMLESEKQVEGMLCNIDFNYLEIGILILANAADDVSESEAVRGLLKDIEEVRGEKIRRLLLHSIDEGTVALKINEISSMELNTMRQFLGLTLQQFQQLSH